MARKEINDQRLFDEIAQEYAKKDMVPSSMIARNFQLLSAAKLILKDKNNLGLVVDIGCGVGAAAKYLKGSYSFYIGIDQSEREIALAKTIHQNNQKVRFLAQNVKTVKLRKKADLVLSLGALHHMTDLKKVFRTLKEIAKPNALLLIIEPQKSNFIINFARILRQRFDPAYSKDQVYFKDKILVKILKGAGLQDIEVDFQGFLVPCFAQVILPPQMITKYLSLLATFVDRGFNLFPQTLKKYLSFNIVIKARFPKGE